MYDDDYGCMGVIIFAAILAAMVSVLKWIGIVALAIAAIALIVYAIKAISSQVEKSSVERAARKEREKLQNVQRQQNEERQKAELERARRAYERMTYNAYIEAAENSSFKDRLEETTALINKMIDDEDEDHRQKILPFFDRYLPLMTSALKSRSDEAATDDMIDIFEETVRSFFADMYQYDDVIEINQKILEKMAAMDGLADDNDTSFGLERER